MTKPLFVLVSVVLASVVAGCSADTAEDGPQIVTTNNGTLPVEAPSQDTVVHTPADVGDVAVKHDLAKVGERPDGFRTITPLELPQLEQQVPALQLKPEPINQ